MSKPTVIPLRDAARTLGVPVAVLKKLAGEPGLPVVWHPSKYRVIGIPADGLAVWARTLEPSKVQTR